MLYPVYIHLGDKDHAHGVTVPDFPGCFSAADDWQGIPKAVQEALEVYCDGEKTALPVPTPLEDLAASPDYQGGVWLLLDIDTTTLDTTTVRLNISLPQSLVNEIDAYAKTHGATRSGFLAQAARAAMNG